MEVIEIPESFINFCVGGEGTACAETDASCVDVVGACFPIYEINDLHFQVLVGECTDAEQDAIAAGTATFWVGVASSCDECSTTNLSQMHVEQWKTTGVDQYDYFVLSLETWAYQTILDQFSEAQCLVFCLYVKDLPTSPSQYEHLGCSSCFIKYTDTCDTSVVKYRMNETSMGFYNNSNPFYDTYFNTIRLPFRLHQPQPKTKKNVYRMSNGNYIKNSASKAMEWVGETDFMSDVWHRKFDIALDHDQLKITNTNSGFSSTFAMSEQDDNYVITWEDFLDYPHAKAEFRLMEMPYNEFNNNCNLTPLNPLTNVNGLLVDAYNLLIWG